MAAYQGKPELVCPAGGLPALKTAVDNGADCVYIGLKDETNARNFAGLNFDAKTAVEGIRYARKSAGYHGGATPAEATVPVVVIARDPESVSPGWKTARGSRNISTNSAGTSIPAARWAPWIVSISRRSSW